MVLKRTFWIGCISVSAILFLHVAQIFAITIPEATGYVNDIAHVLTVTEKAELDGMLKTFEKETSNQIFVAIVPSFQGLDRFSYSQELFTKWKIGQEGKNNGILFLWGPRDDFPFPDKGEIFINVGAGLEGVVTDSLSGEIIRDEVVPLFKKKQYAEGLKLGLLALIEAARGEYAATEQTSFRFSNAGFLNFFIFFAVFILNFFASFLARSKSWWLGGVLGVCGGALTGWLLFADEGWLILFSALGLGLTGLFFDYFLSKNYKKGLAGGQHRRGFWFFGGGRGGTGGFGGGFGGGGGGFSRGGGAGGGY